MHALRVVFFGGLLTTAFAALLLAKGGTPAPNTIAAAPAVAVTEGWGDCVEAGATWGNDHRDTAIDGYEPNGVASLIEYDRPRSCERSEPETFSQQREDKAFTE